MHTSVAISPMGGMEHEQHQQSHTHQHQHQQHQHHNSLHDATYHDHSASWTDHSTSSAVYNPSHHVSPVQEYNGFSFTPLPMEPVYSATHTSSIVPSTAPMHPPRPLHHQLQPLIMPQWPSMLTSQSSYVPPAFPTAPPSHPSTTTPVAITPATPTPVSASSTRSTSSTPRKTLTDNDRRRMCLYHEEHPTVKQTEIGAMFGVERSTVSKVLRQKEKYLYQDDGSRSPIKRSKGKFPDIERALSNWARNYQKQGLPLSDAMIREKARFFATTVGNSDGHLKANSTSWLEKFKQKNNLMGSKSRKNSVAEESEGGGSNPASSAQTPSGISPTSPSGISPSPVATKNEDQAQKAENADNYVDYTNGHRPFHSQSNTSLSSVFTDTAPSTFSAGPTSPTSPFFTPDSACAPSPFIPQQSQQRNRQPMGGIASNFQRPRSQTFPMLGIEPYLSPPPSSEAPTPKALDTTSVDASGNELISPMTVMDDSSPLQHGQGSLNMKLDTTMQPPPIPSGHGSHAHHAISPAQPRSQSLPVTPDGGPSSSPSQEEARRALELVMNFFQSQPTGFVEPQEYVMIGKLMEKLKIQRGMAGVVSIPLSGSNNMHCIPEQEFGKVG